jgi:hypothetical protein
MALSLLELLPIVAFPFPLPFPFPCLMGDGGSGDPEFVRACMYNCAKSPTSPAGDNLALPGAFIGPNDTGRGATFF